MGVYRTVDDRLEARDPVMSVFRYRAVSHGDRLAGGTLLESTRLRETAIDEALNPRIQAPRRDLLEAHEKPAEMIAAVLATIRREPFSYTLSPPLYQNARHRRVLVRRPAGFCEHYASAFVYLMRAAGIPARLVGGYLGGEVNPITRHLMVRQYDAHAWAEVWLPKTAGFAWIRLRRLRQSGLNRVCLRRCRSEDLATLSLFTNARMGDWDLAADVLRWADSIEHRWNLWVVGYDTQFQSRLLEQLLGELTVARIVGAIVGGGVVCLSRAGHFHVLAAPSGAPSSGGDGFS